MTLPSPAPGGFDGVAEIIAGAVDAGAFPGAVILIAQRGEVLYHEAFGSRSLEPERTPMARDTIFDLSSLTKPLATTTAVMLLAREGKLRLDDRVTRFFPNFGVHGKTHVTVRHLLAHCSGLPAWRPFYKDITASSAGTARTSSPAAARREFVYEQIHRERLEQPPGTRAVYSDLGFMLLGELIELVTQSPLDRFCHERIFRPLGLRATGFVDLEPLRRDKLVPITDAIAPTERCPWRQKVLCGEVHDDNAWAMGGVAGHAGLFSTAARRPRAGVAGSARAARGEDPTASRRHRAPSSGPATGPSPTRRGRSAGTRRRRRRRAPARGSSPHAVGHLGFTGTSLWIDLERDAHVILLTNRVHPERDNERIRGGAAARARRGVGGARRMRVHLIAACGVGMSALAGAAARGRAQRHRLRRARRIRRRARCSRDLGVPVAHRLGAARASTASTWSICGNAVRATIPRRRRREARGLRTLSFPQALEELFLDGRAAAGGRRHARQDHVGVHARVGARARRAATRAG